MIPLVQTFGHLEMALKLPEFRGLREVPYLPQAICPSQEGSWRLVTTIIDQVRVPLPKSIKRNHCLNEHSQVLSLHPGSRWLHVGCDEVFQLGQCPLCLEKISAANNDPKESNVYHDGKTLFLQHVHRLGTYVRSKSVIPIIWDDMLRTVPSQTLEAAGIGDVVEPMVWVYIEDIDRFIDPLTWSTFGEVFRHVWTAGAFKGAFGERLYATNIQRHVGNNVAWLEVMRREAIGPGGQQQSGDGTGGIDFRGIVLTGWSRYDHFAVLCELLPSSVPSLVLNLAILAEGAHSFDVTKRVNKLLECTGQKSLMSQEELARSSTQWDLNRCKFLGSDLFSLISSYDMSRKEIESVYDRLTRQDGWMTDYNVRHKYSSVQRVYDVMKSVNYQPSNLRSLELQFGDVLQEYFDGYTAGEWMEQHLVPLKDMIDELRKRSAALTKENVWPRRPLGSTPIPEKVTTTTTKTVKAKKVTTTTPDVNVLMRL